jgi:hypothetical protein
MAKDIKPEDEKKPNFFQKIMGEETSMVTWIIAIIGIMLVGLIGFLIFKKLKPSMGESFSETSATGPSTLTRTPNNYSPTSNDITTTSV